IWQHGHEPSLRLFRCYSNLFFFGDSSDSPERSEIFQATCVVKVLEKLGIHRYSVVGTSYGGFVAFRMAAMWLERVEKVVIASSGVNMRRSDNLELLKREKVEKTEDLMLPSTAAQLRRLMALTVFRLPYIPDFFLNDFIKVGNFTLILYLHKILCDFLFSYNFINFSILYDFGVLRQFANI
ncbi:hypothetical protein PHJA_001802400, partial [Phtheirospermum japonicum]